LDPRRRYDILSTRHYTNPQKTFFLAEKGSKFVETLTGKKQHLTAIPDPEKSGSVDEDPEIAELANPEVSGSVEPYFPAVLTRCQCYNFFLP
jgi:hypothetical protein